ncbi:beta-ketoacyl-ACP synthase III [Quatrionicoccus australiensis]|uniref:beta-ketoacyl-ACP synthase III n=1 Tax=Quatrionicoccus australiensis TaxID=138118 RepID=UPI001CF85846|nr:beta-ketoacyl-ACP synthase III [Quatrionicoccus australiensis]UCV13363.1 beta-ketoacyl-ACP synthase III [Quatrionicoccus australiensis]
MNSSGKVYITRSSAFLPNAPVDNENIENVLGMVGGRPSRARRIVLRNNGIRERYYAIDPATGETTHNNAQLTAAAIRGLDIGDAIDCLSTGTTMPDQLMPNHGVMVHGELGISPCEVVSTAGICLSGLTALKYAYMAVLCGQAKNAVATGSEQASAVLHARNFASESEHRISELESNPEIAFEKDFLRWMLSDGAGAFLLQDQPAPAGLSLRIDWIDILSQAGAMETCMYAGGEKQEDGTLRGWKTYPANEWGRRSLFAIKQDVRLLNENIVRQTIGKILEKSMATRELKPDAVDWFLPHMSSEYFRQPLAEHMAALGFPIPQEKWFTNLHTKGNTGAASIYIMIDELFKSGRLKNGDRLLCFIPESGRFTGSLMHLTAVDHA